MKPGTHVTAADVARSITTPEIADLLRKGYAICHIGRDGVTLRPHYDLGPGEFVTDLITFTKDCDRWNSDDN